MAAAVQIAHGSASSSRQQASSNTAPVFEHACLFTRDLRRKQKRWQDGNLKYHTFNKRVMVYDSHGNFVGDTHWREDYGFRDGDELELERGGIIVQVAECTGSRDQDLYEVVDKRAQERAERQTAALARRRAALETPTTPKAAVPHFQLRHKPLHNLIGTPTGHHGRALMPTESPYEERQKLAMSPPNENVPPVKRRKREISPPSKGGYAQSLFGAALTLSGTPASTPLVRNRPPKVSSVIIDSQPLASSNLGLHDGNSGPAATLAHVEATSPRENIHVKAPRTRLLNKISGVPPTDVIQDMIQFDSSSLPRRGEANPRERSKSTGDTKRQGSRLKEGDREYVPRNSPVHSRSTNFDSRDPKLDKRKYPQLRTGYNIRNDVMPAAVSMGKETENPSPVFGPGASVQSHDAVGKFKPRNNESMLDGNEEYEKVSREQYVNEPRTELRIRPRKKRGLLMMTGSSGAGGLSSLTINKSRIDHHNSLNDAAREEFDDDVLNSERGLDIEVEETDRARRKKQNVAHSIGGVNKRLASVASFDDHSRIIGKHEYYSPGPLNSSRSRSESISSHITLVGSCDAPVAKPRSRNRGTDTRTDRGVVSNAESGGDFADNPHLVTQDGSSEAIHSRVHRNKAKDGYIIAPKPAPGDAILAETTGPSGNRKQPSRRKKKIPTKISTDPHATMGEYDGKQHISDEDDCNFSDSVPTPRLAHLGRKGIRSKEVIGFVFDEETDHDIGGLRKGGEDRYGKGSQTSDQTTNHSRVLQAMPVMDYMGIMANGNRALPTDKSEDNPLVKGTGTASNNDTLRSIGGCNTVIPRVGTISRLPRKTRSELIEIDEEPVVQAQVSEDDAAYRLPPAKVVDNPATRGKKAAEPSDAAGQVPQCPLPPEAAAGTVLDFGRQSQRRSSKLETRFQETTVAPMPGFAEANGGPWSREAYDLFEFTRPP